MSGTMDKNHFACSDGTSDFCAEYQECYSPQFNSPFSLGYPWSGGCRVPKCKCDAPHSMSNSNYTCADGKHGGCWEGEMCIATKYEGYAACHKPETYCSCDTPNTGTEGHNTFTCTDGTKNDCDSHMECYATGNFAYGDWSAGCRVPRCECTTPQNGTAGHNDYACTDSTIGSCASDEECFTTKFGLAGCRQP